MARLGMRGLGIRALGVLALVLSARDAEAQLAADGAPIDSSDYTIDFYTGPILDSARNTGLAGSFSALSAGVGGYAINPASVALRVPWSDTWVDWEIDGSITLPSTLRGTDFDNNGDNRVGSDASFYITAGGGIQLGGLGLGLSVGGTYYETTSTDGDGEPRDLGVSFFSVNVVLGYLLAQGQLALGAGFGVNAVELERILPGDVTRGLAEVSGATVQLGAIWAPSHLSIRTGASLRVSLQDEDAAPEGVEPDAAGNYRVDNYLLPRRIIVPTELHLAFATQLFRPLNVGWRDPRSARPGVAGSDAAASYRALPRERLLLSAALKVTFPTKDGIGTDAFLLQQVERSGQKLVISPRIGAETEPIIDWLVVRAGGYYEPTRFESSSARLHATLGADLHIPIVWSVFGLFDDDTSFRIGGALDGAARYFGWSVSFGVWR